MSQAHITCRILPGFFDHEYYILIGVSSAYCVNREDVVEIAGTPSIGVPVDGKVLGYIVERHGDKTLVQLPGEAAIGSSRTWVENRAVAAV